LRQTDCVSILALCTNRFVKLTPGVNFINVLQASFGHTAPKSTKKDSQGVSFFALSGSEGEKAACRALMKLTPDLILFNPYSEVFANFYP